MTLKEGASNYRISSLAMLSPKKQDIEIISSPDKPLIYSSMSLTSSTPSLESRNESSSLPVKRIKRRGGGGRASGGRAGGASKGLGANRGMSSHVGRARHGYQVGAAIHPTQMSVMWILISVITLLLSSSYVWFL